MHQDDDLVEITKKSRSLHRPRWTRVLEAKVTKTEDLAEHRAQDDLSGAVLCVRHDTQRIIYILYTALCLSGFPLRSPPLRPDFCLSPLTTINLVSPPLLP